MWEVLVSSTERTGKESEKEKAKTGTKMQSIKETASNVAASARSGLEKTKATVEEKVEKATANDLQKEMATRKKEDRIRQAELEKQEVRRHNAAAKQSGGDVGYTAKAASGTHSYSTTGEHGRPTGAQQMSALPGHGTGQPIAQVIEGRVEAHPIGVKTGVGGAQSHNTRVEGNPGPHSYGTGGTYS